MKKLMILSGVAICAAKAFTQGTIVFDNRVVGSVVAPIYGVNPAVPFQRSYGNIVDGFPAGTTVYGGAALSGTGFTAQLWGAPGADSGPADVVTATCDRI